MKSSSRKRDWDDTFVWMFVNLIVSFLISLISIRFNIDNFQSLILGFLSFLSLSLAQLTFITSSFKNEATIITSETRERVLIDAEFKALNLDSYLLELVREIAHISGNILNAGSRKKVDNLGLSSLFDRQALETLEFCLQNLKYLSDGNLRFKKELSDIRWKEIMGALHTSYFTTNVLGNPDSLGQKDLLAYIEPQKKAIERGCKIERIFIYKDEKELQQYDKVIEEQKKIGIFVKVISLNNYDNGEQRYLSEIIGCSDFAIIDGEYVYITVTDNSFSRTKYIELTNNKERLRAAKALFNSVSSIAVER
ncbi:hypothetical protein NIES4101_67780 [Calothrix sp. NIES-4101]|nr:hypothetical protein NIES4101_67780 [Calothrix sp. NIES-4101]